MRRLIFILALIAATGVSVPEAACSQFDGDEVISTIDKTPVLKSASNGIEIIVRDGVAHRFYIYSITGQVIKSVEVTESVTVELPQGYYIVKCQEWARKIVVR